MANQVDAGTKTVGYIETNIAFVGGFYSTNREKFDSIINIGIDEIVNLLNSSSFCTIYEIVVGVFLGNDGHTRRILMSYNIELEELSELEIGKSTQSITICQSVLNCWVLRFQIGSRENAICSKYVAIEILPSNLSDIAGYRAIGVTDRVAEPVVAS